MSGARSVAPDHSAVAFVCDRTGLPRLEIASLESGHGRVAVAGRRRRSSPPAGRRTASWLVYLVSPGGSIRAELHAVRPDGSGHRLLAGGGDRETAFLGAWTAQPGRYVCSVADGVGPDADVVAVDIETGVLEPVPAGTGRGFHTVCAVSADGRWILARRGPRNQRRLYLLAGGPGGSSADGEPIRLLAIDFPLEWTTRRGRQVSRSGRRSTSGPEPAGDRTGLVAVDIAGGAPKPLTSIAFRSDADLESFGILDAGPAAAELEHRRDQRDSNWSGRTASGTPTRPAPARCWVAGECCPAGSSPRSPDRAGRAPWSRCRSTGSAVPVAGVPEHPAPPGLATPASHTYPSLDDTPLQGWLYRADGATGPGSDRDLVPRRTGKPGAVGVLDPDPVAGDGRDHRVRAERAWLDRVRRPVHRRRRRLGAAGLVPGRAGHRRVPGRGRDRRPRPDRGQRLVLRRLSRADRGHPLAGFVRRRRHPRRDE